MLSKKYIILSNSAQQFDNKIQYLSTSESNFKKYYGQNFINSEFLQVLKF